MSSVIHQQVRIFTVLGVTLFCIACDGKPKRSKSELDSRQELIREKFSSPLEAGVVIRFGINLADLVDLSAEGAAALVEGNVGSQFETGSESDPSVATDELTVFLEMCRYAMPYEVKQTGLAKGLFAKKLADFLYDEVYSQPNISGLFTGVDEAEAEFRSLRLKSIAIDEESGTIWPTFEYLPEAQLANLPRRKANPTRVAAGDIEAIFDQAEQELGVVFPAALRSFYVNGTGTEAGILRPVESLLNLETSLNPNMPLRFIPFIDGNSGLDYGIYFPPNGGGPLVGLNVSVQFFTLITADLERYWTDPAYFDIHDEEEFGKRTAEEDRSAWNDLKLGGASLEAELLKPIKLNVGDYERLGTEIKLGAAGDGKRSQLWKIHAMLSEAPTSGEFGLLRAVFSQPENLLSAKHWSELSDQFETSGDLDQALAAAENAVAVGALYPYKGFLMDTREDAERPGYWTDLRKRRRPYFQRVIRLAAKRGDKIALATAKAQLAVLEAWIEE